MPFFDNISETRYGDYSFHGFFLKGRCQYCDTRLNAVEIPIDAGNSAVVLAAYQTRFGADRELRGIHIWQCPTCGFWFVRHSVLDRDRKDDSLAILSESVMKRFDIGSRTVADYLAGHSDEIYYIHDGKMEELVQYVLQDHFKCEVVHVGKSHDRGVDLLKLLGDEVIPIQVKRRTQPGRAEPVTVVRDLLGVLLRDGLRSAMIVTTADRFSRDASREVAEVLDTGRVDRFELIDLDAFLGMLRQYYGGPTRSYLDVVPRICGGNMNGLCSVNLVRQGTIEIIFDATR
jgi:hypothetical protein